MIIDCSHEDMKMDNGHGRVRGWAVYKLSELTEGPDFDTLRNIAKRMMTTTNWWVGFSDLESSGNYVAESDGRYVNLTKYFAVGEPSSNKEHCLEMNYNLDMKLNDRPCKMGGWESGFQPLCQLTLR